MTNTNQKIRALFLTALMVFSVFAGTVAFSGAAAADGNVSVDGSQVNNGTIVYLGQELTFNVSSDSNGNNSRYVLYRGSPGDNPSTVTILTGTSASGNFTVDTSGLASGADYFISSDGKSSSDFEFTTIAQDFSTSFDRSSIGNQGNANATLEIDAQNRPGENFSVYVTADGLDDEDLVEIFDDDANVDVTDADVDDDSSTDDDGVRLDNVTNGAEVTANFTDVSADNYNFTLDVTDTIAEDTASIEVQDTAAGSADLPQRTIQVQQGDIATINVSVLGATDSAKLVVGNEDDDGYQANITVTDGDDDGNVGVKFNTYTAGQSGSSATVVTAVDSDDEVNLTNVNDSEQTLGQILDTGQYRLFAGTSSQFSDVVETPDQVGTLVINERSTDSLKLWTAPQNAKLDGDDDGSDVNADEVTAAVESNTITQSNTIAMGDYVVHQISASGLEGVLANYSGTSAAALKAAIADGVVDLSVVQQNPGANRAPKVLNVTSLTTSQLMVVPAADSDTYYVLFQANNDLDWERAVSRENTTASGNPATIQSTETFKTTFSVTGNRILGESGTGAASDSDLHQSVNATFDLEQRTLELDQETFNVTATANQSITGTSSVAPGSEITVRVSSDSSVQPAFFKSRTVTVQPDGTFNASFDFNEPSGISEGATFSIDASGPGSLSASAEGMVTAQQTTTTTGTAGTTTGTSTTATATATATATSEATATATEEPTEEPTSTSTPGFGAVLAVIALIGAALLAVRRDN